MANYAFIDSQNLYLSIRNLKWKLEYSKLRIYLKEKYNVSTAYLFLGYMVEHQDLYQSLQKDGFIIIFKDSMRLPDGTIKGNCDAELVLQAMIDFSKYDKSIIISGDGDFACLVKYLLKQNKLEKLLVPNQNQYSGLLKKAAKDKLDFISSLQNKLEYKPKK